MIQIAKIHNITKWIYQLHGGSLPNHSACLDFKGECLSIRIISNYEKLKKKTGELQKLSELGKLPKSTIQNIILSFNI